MAIHMAVADQRAPAAATVQPTSLSHPSTGTSALNLGLGPSQVMPEVLGRWQCKVVPRCPPFNSRLLATFDNSTNGAAGSGHPHLIWGPDVPAALPSAYTGLFHPPAALSGGQTATATWWEEEKAAGWGRCCGGRGRDGRRGGGW